MTAHRSSSRPPTRSRRIGLGALTTLALLTACSGPVASLELGLGSTATAVIRGGTVDVDVVLTRTGGASGPVALSVTGLPASVTASFAPPTLDDGATTSVLTLSATAAAAEGAAILTFVATGASLTAEATLALAVESLTIAGGVSGVFGLPIANVQVSSQGETTTTNAEGAFELDGLSIPYDLALTRFVGSGAVHVFEDLTTAAPVLAPVFVLDMALPTADEATISGDVLSGGAVPADQVVIVCAEGVDLVVFGCDYAGTGDTAYTLAASWFGPTTTTVRVHALHVEFAADDTPVAYLGYEAFDLSLSDTDVVARDVALSAVTSTVIEGSIDAADGMAIAAVYGSVRFGPRLSMLALQTSSLADDVALLVPTPPGATYDLTAVADGPNGPSFAWALDLDGDFGTLEVPPPLTMGTPAAAAVGVTTTTPFTSSGSAEVRTYLFSGAGPMLALTTTRASVTVPDPTDYGLAFPDGANYSWHVFGHGNTDADAALSRSLLDYYALFLLTNEGGPGLDESGVLKFGTARAFTFAP